MSSFDCLEFLLSLLPAFIIHRIEDELFAGADGNMGDGQGYLGFSEFLKMTADHSRNCLESQVVVMKRVPGDGLV